MENQSFSNPQNSQQQNTTSLEQNTSSKKQTGLLFPVLITLLISAVVFGLGGYYVGSQLNDKTLTNENSVAITPTPNSQAINTPNLMESSESVSDWNTYTNTSPAYTIQYPADWIVDNSKALVDAQTGGQLIIMKDNYKLTISWPSAYGPSGCIFNDQPEYQKFDSDPMPQFSLCKGEFKQFDNESGSIHRRLVNPTITPSGDTIWSVYTKETNSNYFVAVPPINYTTPKNYDKELINTMDEILSSYQIN